jgi:hypothetical protein
MSQMQQEALAAEKEKREAQAREEGVEKIEQNDEEKVKAVRKTEDNTMKRQDGLMNYAKQLRDAKQLNKNGDGDAATGGATGQGGYDEPGERKKPKVRARNWFSGSVAARQRHMRLRNLLKAVAYGSTIDEIKARNDQVFSDYAGLMTACTTKYQKELLAGLREKVLE